MSEGKKVLLYLLIGFFIQILILKLFELKYDLPKLFLSISLTVWVSYYLIWFFLVKENENNVKVKEFYDLPKNPITKKEDPYWIYGLMRYRGYFTLGLFIAAIFSLKIKGIISRFTLERIKNIFHNFFRLILFIPPYNISVEINERKLRGKELDPIEKSILKSIKKSCYKKNRKEQCKTIFSISY